VLDPKKEKRKERKKDYVKKVSLFVVVASTPVPVFHFSAENISALSTNQIDCSVNGWTNQGSFGGSARAILNSEVDPVSTVIPTVPSLVQYGSHLGLYFNTRSSLLLDLGTYLPPGPLQFFVAFANDGGLTATNFFVAFIPFATPRVNAGAGVFFQVPGEYYVMDGTSSYYPDGLTNYAPSPPTVNHSFYLISDSKVQIAYL